jgi:hypothetical protein
MIRISTLSLLLAAGIALPASAADYYLTARYNSTEDVGEMATLVNADTIRAGDGALKIADILNVNAADRVVTVFTVEIDCAAHAWRVIGQVDHRTDGFMAPQRLTITPQALAPVPDSEPNRKTLDFVCAWPGGATGVQKFTEPSPEALSKKIAPMLKFFITAPPERG